MSYELKIKAKSLAAESRIIRQEEIKYKKRARYHASKQEHEKAVSMQSARKSLYEHRIEDVKGEARATHLARAYIKGLNYAQVERPRDPDLNVKLFKRTEKLINKYSPEKVSAPDLTEWFTPMTE